MTEIALIGNPNSGKTSLFNLITGNNQRVGNWPGVTVERKSGLVKKNKRFSNPGFTRGFTQCHPIVLKKRWRVTICLSQRADSIFKCSRCDKFGA